MATVLMPALRRIGARCPRTILCTYADDRTVAARTRADLAAVELEWALLETVTALRTNAAKTQSFHLRPDSTDHDLANMHMKALGVDFGMQRQHFTGRERKKINIAIRRLQRIAHFSHIPETWPWGPRGRRPPGATTA